MSWFDITYHKYLNHPYSCLLLPHLWRLNSSWMNILLKYFKSSVLQIETSMPFPMLSLSSLESVLHRINIFSKQCSFSTEDFASNLWLIPSTLPVKSTKPIAFYTWCPVTYFHSYASVRLSPYFQEIAFLERTK